MEKDKILSEYEWGLFTKKQLNATLCGFRPQGELKSNVFMISVSMVCLNMQLDA